MYTQYHTTSTFKIWGFKSTFASIYTHNTRIFANFDATMTLRGSWLLQFPRSLASKAWYTKPGWSLKMESLPAIFFESNKIGRGEVATKIPTSHGVYPSFEESNLRPGPTSSTPSAGIWDTSQPISACGWRWRCGFPTYHWLISSPETSTETWIDSSENNSTPSELMHSLEVKLPLSCGEATLPWCLGA